MTGIKHSNGYKIDDVLPTPEPEMVGPSIAPQSVKINLETILSAVRPIKSNIPVDCYSAATLGTHREGNAVLIDKEGLFLTIGYLLVEATDILIGGLEEKVLHAQAVGYDHETGFGLLRSVERPDFAPMQLASDADHLVSEKKVIVAAHGGVRRALDARIADRRLFAGSWEYMLESAIFTAPLHPSWSGAALIDPETGFLCGIGSLFIQGPGENDKNEQGNMFVPIELLSPILNDMIESGRRIGPSRPWLGMHLTEAMGHLVVSSVFDNGPADRADIRPGDVIDHIEDQFVDTLELYYRNLWSTGEAGASVKLGIIRGTSGSDIFVRSGNRHDFYKLPQKH
ncbi:MAG: signal protein PDZ [Rhodospirillaceae bacterium]|nr:signal protein PDZ [Rhodospirillaceae bacterium]|tara:strand:- start:2299 stop:3321 length:1023 start_codon:yes stop_codon:yes gene_type:complete